MDRDFPPHWLVPDWVRPAAVKEPSFLRQAAYFSLYAPFALFLISVIVTYATYSSPAWRHHAMVVYTIIYRVTIVAAFGLGVLAFVGGIKHRCVVIYVCAFWGCLFNGILLTLVVLSFLGH